MNILGININHADASACLVVNGEIIFAIEEEFDINIPYNANETLSKRLDFSNVLSIVELVSELVRDNHKF